MKANTAVGLVLLGTALWLDGCGEFELRRGARRLVLILAGMTTLIGALTILEYATSQDFHIDELLVHDASALSITPPGRMAINTAISFVLLGCALPFTKHRRGVLVSQLLTLAASGLCVINLIGYLYGIQNFRGIAFYTAISIHTSFTLLVLSLGVLGSTADAGLMATVGDAIRRGVQNASCGAPLRHLPIDCVSNQTCYRDKDNEPRCSHEFLPGETESSGCRCSSDYR